MYTNRQGEEPETDDFFEQNIIYAGRKPIKGWRAKVCPCCIGRTIVTKCRSIKKKERRPILEDESF